MNTNIEPEGTGKQETGDKMPVNPTRISFVKELLSRRVPQILGGYLAASWIIASMVHFFSGCSKMAVRVSSSSSHEKIPELCWSNWRTVI